MLTTAVSEVKAVLAGTPERLYDLRYRGVLDEFKVVEREVDGGRARLVLAHPTRGRLEVIVEARPATVSGASRPANATEIDDVLLTFAGAAAMADPQDRGALEHYREVARQEEGGATTLTLVRRGGKAGLELTIRVTAAA